MTRKIIKPGFIEQRSEAELRDKLEGLFCILIRYNGLLHEVYEHFRKANIDQNLNVCQSYTMYIFNFRELVERVKGLSAHVNEDLLVRYYLESKGSGRRADPRKQHLSRVERGLRAEKCGQGATQVLQPGHRPDPADLDQQPQVALEAQLPEQGVLREVVPAAEERVVPGEAGLLE